MLTIDGKIQYNCWDGENTFYPQDFLPVRDVEILAKDIIDCNVQYLKNIAIKKEIKILLVFLNVAGVRQNFLFKN